MELMFIEYATSAGHYKTCNRNEKKDIKHYGKKHNALMDVLRHVSLCATSGGRESLADSFEVFNVATVQDPGFTSILRLRLSPNKPTGSRLMIGK